MNELSQWVIDTKQKLAGCPEVEYNTYKPTDGELNNLCYLSMKYIAGFDMRNVDFTMVKTMGGDPQFVATLTEQFIPQLATYIWDHLMGEPEDPTVATIEEAIEVIRDMLYEQDAQTRDSVDAE
jgi:hypothetical protein